MQLLTQAGNYMTGTLVSLFFLMLFDVSSCGCGGYTQVTPPIFGTEGLNLPARLSSVKLIGVNIYIDYQAGHYPR